MIHKVFKRGRGKASGIDYLMSAKDAAGIARNPPAQLIKGDIAITKDLISGLRFSQKYTSGVLSWSERPELISEEQVKEVIESFQETVSAGLGTDRLNWLWVMHRDKGRLELHYIIPNVDLVTGKRFAPYFDRVDRPLFRAWERLTNVTYGFSNPADPGLKQSIVVDPYLPKDKKTATSIIHLRLQTLIRAGKINSRNDVINDLKKMGFQVNRTGKDYISISDKNNTKLRLKGKFFEENFHNSNDIAYEKNNEDWQDIEKLTSEFNTQLEKRRRYLSGRYKAPPLQKNEMNIQEHINARDTKLDSNITTEHPRRRTETLPVTSVAARSVANAISTLATLVAKAITFINLSQRKRPSLKLK